MTDLADKLHYLLALALSMLAVSGCALSRHEQIHAFGQVAGNTVSTRVDSPLAEYYIEEYSQGNRSNPQFNQQIDEIASLLDAGVPDNGTLEYITRKYKRDVATIALAEQLAADPVSAPFVGRYHNELALITTGQVNPAEQTPLIENMLVLFVPGWYWKDDSYDAEMKVPRQILARHGYQTELLQTDEKGTVEANAEILARRIRNCPDRPIMIVSVSKGGAETALVLGELLSPAESRNVLAWVNINGAIRGALLTNEYLSWNKKMFTRLSMRFLYHDSLAGMKSMRKDYRTQVYNSLHLPANLKIVNLTAIPFSGQVNKRVCNSNRFLDKVGPNDGSLLIADQLVENVPTVVELGFDHFFFDPLVGAKSLAAVRALEQVIAYDRAVAQDLPAALSQTR